MEAEIERAGFEVDVTREDCIKKRNQFFRCVVDKKKELSDSLAEEQWKNFADHVNKIQFDCAAEKGLAKCEAFFYITDIKY